MGGGLMSLFEKCTKAWNESDNSALLECHHDDYELVSHSNGEVKRWMTLTGINHKLDDCRKR